MGFFSQKTAKTSRHIWIEMRDMTGTPTEAEDEPLRPLSWTQMLKDKTITATKSVKDATLKTLKSPIPSLLGLGTSAQPAVSAFVNPSDIKPEDITKSWWQGLSTAVKIQSILSLVFSLGVNYPVGKRFISEAVTKVKANAKTMFKTPGNLIDNSASLFLGLQSGVGAAVITFETFLWIQYGYLIIPITLAALSFVIASTSRYIGVRRVFAILKSKFSHDAQAQSDSVEALAHLKLDETTQAIQDVLQQMLEEETSQMLATRAQLTEEDYEKLFLALLEKLVALENLHPDQASLFNEKTNAEYAKMYAHTLVKLSFALLFGCTAASVFMQKGYDGINILSKLLAQTDLEQTIDSDWVKRLIGLPSGLASGMLYGASASEFPKLFFVTLPSYLYQNPKQILATLFMLIANYYAPSSLQNVTSNILKRNHHLLGALGKNEMKVLLPYLTRAGCGFVNILSDLREFMPKPVDVNRPKIKDVIEHFEDVTRHPLSHTTALQCAVANHKLSFFAPKPATGATEHQRELAQHNQIVLI